MSLAFAATTMIGYQQTLATLDLSNVNNMAAPRTITEPEQQNENMQDVHAWKVSKEDTKFLLKQDKPA